MVLKHIDHLSLFTSMKCLSLSMVLKRSDHPSLFTSVRYLSLSMVLKHSDHLYLFTLVALKRFKQVSVSLYGPETFRLFISFCWNAWNSPTLSFSPSFSVYIFTFTSAKHSQSNAFRQHIDHFICNTAFFLKLHLLECKTDKAKPECFFASLLCFLSNANLCITSCI